MDITLGKIVSYPFGLLLILLGLAGLAGSPIAGIIALLAGLIALPIVRGKIDSKFDIAFSRYAVVGIVLVGFVVGMGGVAMNMSSGGGSGDTPNAQESGENKKQTQEETKVHDIGDTFTVGSGEKKIEYTITDVKTATSVGGDYGEEADGVFVIVELEMTNIGKESIDITSSLMKLVDSQQREYEVDSDAAVYVDEAIVYEQLDPGVSKKGYLIFDVPEDQEGRKLKIDPAGVFSNADSHLVKLE